MCVDHLHRCKTSFCLFCAFVVGSSRFSCHVCRGTQDFTGTVSNEATSEMGYPAWQLDVPASGFVFVMGCG